MLGPQKKNNITDKLKKTVSVEQFETLVEYMESYPDFALGRCKSKEGRALSQRRWSELSSTLNSVNSPRSSERTAQEWAKYYTDYKARLNAKIRAIRASQTKTGGGQGDIATLSPLETRLAAILGHHPGERNQLEEARHMPIFGSEPQNSQAEEQMDMPSGTIFQEEIIIPHENYDYSAQEITSQEDETVAPNPSQDRSSVQKVLLDLGRQQAQANETMAAAIENLAAASNKNTKAMENMAKAMENMATAISNSGDKLREK